MLIPDTCIDPTSNNGKELRYIFEIFSYFVTNSNICARTTQAPSMMTSQEIAYTVVFSTKDWQYSVVLSSKVHGDVHCS